MFKEARHSFVVRLALTLILIPGLLGIKPAQPVSAATMTVTNTNDSGAASLRQAIASAPGTLDATFSGDGKLPVDFGNNVDIGQFIVAQPDGKLIVIGSSTPDINADFALARYNSDGSPDMTFDGDGKVTTDFVRDLFGSGHDVAYAGALQSDGKLVVAGETSGGSGYYQSFAVARYNANGSVDSSFDGDGRVTTDFGNDNYGRSVAVQPDGKIVVSGITSSGTTSYFALARYNANGSLDSTFDQDGKLIADFHGWGVYGGKIVLQSDGKILLAGSRTDPYNEDDFAVARYNPDGSLDTNFGGGGLVVTNIFSADDFCNSIAIQPDGKIILAGSSYDAGVSYPVMARYGTNGELDTSFGTNGKVISTSNGSGMEGKAVAIQPNGKILIGGHFWDISGSGGNFALQRYNPDGSLDTTFGTGGRALADFGNNDQAFSVAIQQDGKVVLAGTTYSLSVNPDFALARFIGDETLTVTKTADTNDGACNNDCSLREAVAVASAGATINFVPSLTGQTISLTSTLLIEKDLTIDAGALTSKISISGAHNVRAFEITAGVTTRLNHLIITNGKSDLAGGISNYGALHITNSLITNNSGWEGGGIGNDGTLDITNSTVSGNSVTYNGGGIYTNNGILNVTNTTFSNNSAAVDGGGIYNDFEGTLNIKDSTISNNSALQGGGGVKSNGILNIANSAIVGNSSGLNAGGVYSYGPMNLSDSIVSNNVSNTGHVGGGILSYDKSSIVNSIISNNSATEGGGIDNVGTLHIERSLIIGNAATYGGGIQASNSKLNIIYSTLSDNSAVEGGGGILAQEGDITVTNSTFSNNSAAGGGAVFISYGGVFNSTNNTFSNNSAQNGGGVFNNGSTLNSANNTFSGNSASTGGAIYNVGILNYVNTILANSVSGNDCYNQGDISGIIGVNTNNLVETNAASPYNCGTPAITVDPKLGPLGDNNGATQTMALLSGSPAINAGDDTSCPVADQRGITRPQGSRCDIGAYETEGSIKVSIAGYEFGSYPLSPSESKRISYKGINNGPVQITDVESGSLIASERVIYKVNNVNTSFSEMMGLPNNQLDKTYWLPWYNNMDLDTQLRIGNVSGSTATVNVYIGGTLMTPTAITLLPGQSTRTNFATNNGPVKIVSNVNIVAAERVIYKVNNVQTSFTEMMALPDNQLNTTYWMPWYNNVDLDTQLRIGNVSGSPAIVHVLIGGTEVTPVSGIPLAAGASTRVSFAGVNNGPVRIQSDQKIVVAERVIFKVNGTQTSFSEMMALPDNQLNTIYWLPWYNNTDLDTQLRIGNVSGTPATVHVFVGGTELTPVSGIPLAIGASTRVSFAGVNNGPVRIQSDQKIVAAQRVIYKVNSLATSFSEMMALPDNQLNPTSWLPWYNNIDLDTQLRFAVP